MPYEEYIVERISRVLDQKKVVYTSQKMMGGIVYMVDDKMLCATSIPKKFGVSVLMCRVGEEAALRETQKETVVPMDHTGKRMKDFVYVMPEGYDSEDDLEYYISLCLKYNPIAPRSKK